MLLAVAAQAQLLWKVSGNGLARPSYIMGTYHFAPASVMDEIPGMQQALDGCDMVVGEIEKDDVMTPDFQMAMMQAMAAPPDSTLDKLYTPEEYAIIENVFNKYMADMGVTLSMMNGLKPMGISMQLQAAQALKESKEDEPHGITSFIDMAVQMRANDMGRPSAGLEGVDEQIDLLFNTPLHDQARSLLETCKNDDLFEEMTDYIIEAYMKQDLDAIGEIFADPEVGGYDSESLELLIYKRNRNWAEKLVTMMPERACLVCVGAGHLPGDQGLLQLLRGGGETPGREQALLEAMKPYLSEKRRGKLDRALRLARMAKLAGLALGEGRHG